LLHESQVKVAEEWATFAGSVDCDMLAMLESASCYEGGKI
jgi:hypothetical protein